MIKYKPYDERTPDTQYQDLLRRIIDEGIDKTPIHARLPENQGLAKKGSRDTSGLVLRYDMRNGFPVLTERNLRKAFHGAIGELVAFMNGAVTLEELEQYGCPKIWWENWLTKEKCDIWGLPKHHMGRGSYGASLALFHTADKGQTFNQIRAVMRQMKEMPFLRTHAITTWNPPYSLGDPKQNCPREVVVAPCHGDFVHFILFDEQEEVHVTHTQRSADVPVGLQFNIIEWASIGLMVAHIMGYEFTMYTHFISNPHYYGVQEEAIKELLSREPRRFPTVTLEPGKIIENLEDFRPDDFVLGADYDPHPWLNIPTMV
jgi:thymidylate synthase